MSKVFSSKKSTVAVNEGGTGQTSYTNGQLLIGNTTGNTLAKSTLTAGNGITIANGTGSISVSANIQPLGGGGLALTTYGSGLQAFRIDDDGVGVDKISGPDGTGTLSSPVRVLVSDGTTTADTVGWQTLANVCFLKGTKITLANGKQRSIEDLTLKDKVLTYNIEGLSKIRNKNFVYKWSTDEMKGSFSESGIKNIWINPTDSYLVINDILRITGHHLIHFKRDNRYYFNFAEALQMGEELMPDNNNYEKIETIEEVKEEQNVYNFEVDKDQTYFADNYLVHHYCKLCSGYANII